MSETIGQPLRALISLSSHDLVAERDVAIAAVGVAGMASWQIDVATMRPAPLQWIAEQCELFVLILGPHYGSNDSPEHATERSESQRAFTWARHANPYKILPFMRADALQTPDAKQSQFITQVQQSYRGLPSFSTPEQLRQQIIARIAKWRQQTSKAITDYFAALTQHVASSGNTFFLAGAQTSAAPSSVQLRLREIPQRLWSDDNQQRDYPNVSSWNDPLGKAETPLLATVFASPRAAARDVDLTEHPHVLLLGEAGAGKTTFLRQFLNTCIQNGAGESLRNQAPLPIAITAFDLQQKLATSRISAQSVTHAVARHSGETSGKSARRAALTALTSGKALLIVDGFDEISLGKQQTVLAALQTIGSNQVILASRPTPLLDNDLPGWHRYALRQLDSSQRAMLVATILHRRGQQRQLAPDQPDLDHFEQILARHPTLHDQQGNPLIMTMAAAYFADNGDLPQTLAALFRFTCDTALVAPKRTEASHRDTTMTKQLLLQLALRMSERDLVSVNRATIMTLVAPSDEASAASAIDDMLASAAIVPADSAGHYRFIHFAVQEYLTALALADLTPDGRIAAIIERSTSQQWGRISQFLVDDLDQQQRRAEADAVLYALVKADEHFVPMLRGRDQEHRALALATHIHINRVDPTQSPGVMDAIKRGWRPVWRAAEERYRRQGGNTWLGTAGMLAWHPATKSQRAVADITSSEMAASAALGSDTLQQITPETDSGVMRNVGWSLAGLGIVAFAGLQFFRAQPVAQGHMGTVLQQIVPFAVLALLLLLVVARYRSARLTSNHARIALMTQLLRQRGFFRPMLADPEIPLSAHVMAHLGAQAGLRELALAPQPTSHFLQASDKYMEELRSLLVNADATVREAALGMLGRLGQPAMATIPDLRRILAEDASAQVHVTAVQVLGGWGKAALPALPELRAVLLSDKYYRVRAEAATVLGKLGAVAHVALPDLRDVMRRDTFYLVRRAAVTAVGQWGYAAADALPEVRDALLYDTDASVREAALTAVGQLGLAAHSLLPELRTALAQADDPNVRAMAAQALGLWHEDISMVLPAMHSILASSGDVSTVRAMAVNTLGQWGGEALSALPELRRVLAHDPSPMVRAMAAQTIGEWGGQAAPALGDLRRALYDGDADVRMMAVQALGQWGPPALALLPDMVTALEHDENASVRASAARALGALGKAAISALPLLRAMLRHEQNMPVKIAVVNAIGVWGTGAIAAIPELVALLRSGNRELARAVQDVLESWGTAITPSLPDIIDLLSDPDERVALGAYDVLRSLGAAARAGLPQLLTIMQSGETATCCYAASIVGQVGALSTQAVPTLPKVLAHLGRAGCDRRLPVSVRVAALTAIGDVTGLINAPIVPPLLRALHDPADEIRVAAAVALRQSGSRAQAGLLPPYHALSPGLLSVVSTLLAVLGVLVDWPILALIALDQAFVLWPERFGHVATAIFGDAVAANMLSFVKSWSNGWGLLIVLVAYVLLNGAIVSMRRRMSHQQALRSAMAPMVGSSDELGHQNMASGEFTRQAHLSRGGRQRAHALLALLRLRFGEAIHHEQV